MATTEELLTQIRDMLVLFYDKEIAYKERLKTETQERVYIPESKKIVK